MKKKIIILIELIFSILNSTKMVYKRLWNLNIPNPYKKDIILKSEGIDGTSYFEKRYYKKEDIEYLKNMKEAKEIEKDKDDIYFDVIVGKYLMNLNKKELKKFRENFKWDDIAIENNYYILLEKENSEVITTDLIIIDTKNKIVYNIFNNI